MSDIEQVNGLSLASIPSGLYGEGKFADAFTFTGAFEAHQFSLTSFLCIAFSHFQRNIESMQSSENAD